jgi:uncharacterized protein
LSIETNILGAVLIFAAAVLYSMVGHAGASGYLAAMALLGVPPGQMKPAALGLNILVAGIATWKFYRAGAFNRVLFWPLAITSIPCAFLGGFLVLPGQLYKPVVGIALLFGALHLFRTASILSEDSRNPARFTLVLLGGTLGLLAGLTGVGGGIFLSPLLLSFRWAKPKIVSGVTAAFILVNSIAGLTGFFFGSGLPAVPAALPGWGLAAIAGGFLGAELGSKRLSNPTIKRALALVLVVAGLKLILTA